MFVGCCLRAVTFDQCYTPTPQAEPFVSLKLPESHASHSILLEPV